MATAYTCDELDEFDTLFARHLPRVPVQDDLAGLPTVASLSAAGAPTGLLIRFRMTDQQIVLLFFTPVVALRMMQGIQMTADDGAWWRSGPVAGEISDPLPTTEEARNAKDVVSMATASANDLMIVHLAHREGRTQFVGIGRPLATDLFLMVQTANEKFEWWNEEFDFWPCYTATDRITDKEVWIAAQQLINRYPVDPEIEAAQRADHAYELGDMFNFGLWGRVSNAVKELLRQKPGDGQAIN